MYCSVAEVDDGGGVDGVTHEACLEVEVRAGASSGASAQADGLPCFYHLVRFDKDFVEVSVAFGFVVGETHFAVVCGIDGVIEFEGDVHAFVHSAEACAVSVG